MSPARLPEASLRPVRRSRPGSRSRIPLFVRRRGAPLSALAATVVLGVLKLTGRIDWSWPAILSPLWLPPVLAIATWGLGLCIARAIGELQKRLTIAKTHAP